MQAAQVKGLPVVNLIQMNQGEKVKSLVTIKAEDAVGEYLFFVTRHGIVKRVHVSEFESIRQTGKIAIGLKEDDELLTVKLTTGENEIIIAGANGKAVRFKESDVRTMGRTASGVRGFNIDDSVAVGAATDKEGMYILSITENGYGKKTDLSEYRLTNRGAKGVKNY